MHPVMSGIHLVCVLLFLGSLYAPSVIAAEHDREVLSFGDKMIALTDKFSNAFADHDWDVELSMWDKDAYLSVEGIPLAHGKEAIRKVMEMAGKQLHDKTTEYIEVGPLEEGADYVYVLFTDKWHDHGKLIRDTKLLLVWRNTDDGYKVSFLMINNNE